MGRILLIEGEPGERLILRGRLRESGHEVLVAESGAKGLAEAREGGLDMALLSADSGPGVDCSEVCRRLKATPGLNFTPVVTYSHTQDAGDLVERMYEAGSDAFIGRGQLQHLERIIEVQLRQKAQGDELAEHNRVLDLEIRRMGEERQRAADLQATKVSGDPYSLIARELAAGRPDGALVVDGEGVVRECDRGAVELLGSRILGASLGKIAPGCGLEAFVRDARTAPREGFRFETSARRDRSARSLMASVMPVTGGEGLPLRVLLLLDLGKRRVAAELVSSNDPGIPRQQLGPLIEAARLTYVPAAVTGNSGAAGGLRDKICRQATRPGPVLILGEPGTGREHVARIIHYSGTGTGSFLQMHCGSMSGEMLEAELLGLGKGHAPSMQRPGLLSLARDGTLFLSEVGELPLTVQERLHEILEAGILYRIGSRKKERVDCRLIASSSRDLESLTQKGEFHAGLYGQLSASKVVVPPLRERREDIRALAESFLARFGSVHGVEAFSEEAVWAMEGYRWPGNVAELEDCVEQACARAGGETIEVSHLTRPLRGHAEQVPAAAVTPVPRAIPRIDGSSSIAGTHLATAPQVVLTPWSITDEDPISLDLYERKVLLRALDSTSGDKLAAARLLHVGKSTLYRKLKKFGIT